jgi:hypothetical protein
MDPRLAGLFVALLLATACGVPMRKVSNAISVPRTCQDGLPVVLIQSLTCPSGFCGYTCAPARWDAACLQTVK